MKTIDEIFFCKHISKNVSNYLKNKQNEITNSYWKPNWNKMN